MGLMTACELVAAGEIPVVLDRAAVGSEASWAAGGIISPLFPWRYQNAVTALTKFSQDRYPAFCAELSRLTGIDPEFVVSGMLVLDSGEETIAEAWAVRCGAVCRRIAGIDIRATEPAVCGGSEGAILLPEVAQVRNPRLIKALKIYLADAGVQFIENTAAIGFEVSDRRLRGVRTATNTLAAERCIVTAGAWTAQVLASTNIQLPLRPVKGQMLLLHAPPLVRAIILGNDIYLIPRSDGQILVGSTVEECGFDKSVTEGARSYLLNKAINLVPALKQARVVHQWAGLRPGSPNSVPFIGEHPRVRGLFVNAGHHRNGIVTAPASARLLVDLMLGRVPILPPSPYAVP